MTTSSGARGALRIVLFGLLAGWVLVVAAVYALETGPGHGPGTTETYDWSIYVFFAALVVFGGAALIGARRAAAATAAEPVLGRAVYHHALTAAIIATAAGAFAMVVIFFSFFGSSPASALVRVVNAYVPLLLFTAVVVWFLLAAFVFRKPAPTAPVVPPAPESPTGADTRLGAIAYALPIIVAAFAAITAGIIYDVTGTALTAWLWAQIFALVAPGLVAGTYAASKLPGRGGAYGLNFAWVIVFAAVGSLVALGFGAASVSHLSVNAQLSVDAYAADGSTQVDVHGYDLRPRSAVSVTLAPGGQELHEFTTDAEGWFYDELTLGDLPPGEHELLVQATGVEGSDLEVAMPIRVAGAEVIVPTPHGQDLLSRTMPISWGWLGTYVLPAFLMLVLVAAVVYLTAVLRARSGAVPHSSLASGHTPSTPDQPTTPAT